MRRFTTRWLTFVLVLGTSALGPVVAAPHAGTPKTPEVITQLHWAGLQQLNDSNARTLREIWNLPATMRFRDDTLNKVATVLASFWRPHGDKDTGHNAAVALIRPLLNDVGESEFVLEVVEHPEDLLESTLLVQLNEGRRQLWQTNLGQLFARGHFRTQLSTERVSVASSNSWLVVHAVSGAAADGIASLKPAGALARLQAGERPVPTAGEHLLTLTNRLDRWAEWTGRWKDQRLAQLELTVSGRREYLRSEGRLKFQDPLPIKVEQWQIPMETIRDPLVSFTAIQGLSSWLGRQTWLKDLGLTEPPNQLYLWGSSQTAFQLQAAAPVPNAAHVINRVTEKFVPSWNRTLAEYAVGNMIRLTDRVEVVWRGLPLLVPYLNPVRDQGRDYLHAGIFPVDPSPTKPPPQLFQQLTSQTNLLYYDWELTEARLVQLRPLMQLGTVFLTLPPLSTNSSAFKWLDAVEPRLGNTVTEVTMTAPRELQWVRTSHLGLNGLELLGLVNWLEGTNFPNMKPNIFFRPVVRGR